MNPTPDLLSADHTGSAPTLGDTKGPAGEASTPTKTVPSAGLSIYVDAVDVESQIARLLYKDAGSTGGETWRAATLPLGLLPIGTTEGSWLQLSLTALAAPADMAAGPLRAQLRRQDDGKDFAL
jgi:hypothetical protein